MVPWVGLWCVIMVFPDHTHLLFGTYVFAIFVEGFCLTVFYLLTVGSGAEVSAEFLKPNLKLPMASILFY